MIDNQKSFALLLCRHRLPVSLCEAFFCGGGRLGCFSEWHKERRFPNRVLIWKSRSLVTNPRGRAACHHRKRQGAHKLSIRLSSSSENPRFWSAATFSSICAS